MKKSKIIIPAAAILALSVGASVTGTVAWFSAARTATISASNLAAINTAGDLKVSLTAVHGTSIDKGKVSLSYLRDVSYEHKTDTAFVAVLDTKGENVIATRKLSESERKSHSSVKVSGTSWGNTESVDVYYYNAWTATFSTTSKSDAANYLLFDSTRTVSKIGTGDDGIDSIGNSSIYKAVRVGMKCNDLSFVWAPYTSLSDTEVAYISKAGELKEFQSATSKPDYKKYVTSAESNAELYSIYGKAITTTPEAVVREGSLKSDVDLRKGLLSKTLTSDSPATVEFKLWFEGIDPDCINGSDDITTAASKAVKDMSLSFYAIDSTTLATE